MPGAMTRSAGSPSLRAEFDREAPGYDRTARASMPGYSELHRTLVRGIPLLPTRSFRILELGVGTGALTSAVLETFPHARLVGIDVSPKMIAAARRRLHAYRDRVELLAGRLEDAWKDRYDVVLSALAIHHLADREKWGLFRRVFRSLAPGGYFGDGDDDVLRRRGRRGRDGRPARRRPLVVGRGRGLLERLARRRHRGRSRSVLRRRRAGRPRLPPPVAARRRAGSRAAPRGSPPLTDRGSSSAGKCFSPQSRSSVVAGMG